LKEVVICSPLRTPVGRFGGMFRDLAAAELGTLVIKALVERSGIAADQVDDVLFAQCYGTAEAPAIGRVVALDAGLPITACGMQLDRRCGSGLQAIVYAALQVATGGSRLVIAGGVESMSHAAFYSVRMRWGGSSDGGVLLHDSLSRGRVTAGGVNFPVPGGMLETAENLRREFGISRQEQDEWALRSHQRAVSAQREGRFAAELVEVSLPCAKERLTVSRDEHPRADASMSSLAKLVPIRARQDAEATVTAGNASGQNDGAAACIVTTREHARALGLTPMARFVSWGLAGVEPARMGIGPVPATQRALDNAGLTLADMDLIELNEAFASQVLACFRGWRLAGSDLDRVNVNGSGISLGHPVGATGGRILATMLHELERRQARYALETMCVGGGQGIAAIFERVRGG